MGKLFSLRDLPLKDKTVLVRVDYNIPLKKGKVKDNTKIKASLPTIKYLLRNNCKIILATHLGRPKGKKISALKTNSLARLLKRLLPGKKIVKLNGCVEKGIKKRIEDGKNKEIFLLENLRFYKGEKENSLVFARSLANLADFYVNNAFAVSHRKHASVHAITKFIPSCMGLLMEKEISQLSKILKPKKPLIWILGGIKKDKTSVLKYLLIKADYVLVGSGLYPFLKNKKHKKIVLPVDLNLKKDIGSETINLYKIYLMKAKTIIWNGPLGKFEERKFAKGSKIIAGFIAKLKAVSIIGGGETSEMINKFGLSKKMTWVSTGGGASLEFLLGKKLQGVKALEKNYKKFKKKS
jgi:3-phosphoglycerate kinase